MAGYIFRSRRVFTLEELTRLEGAYIEDLDPASPVTGVGSGVINLIGEFDDGPLETLTEIEGADLTRQFGTLGFTYDGVPANNPCARKRAGELWNGNGFIYSRYIRGQRFLVVRVDTSVGEVAFSPLALLKAGKGPFALAVGDTVAITTSTGSASTPAIAAAEAQAVGSAAIVATGFLGGEQISLQLDENSAPLVVTFAAADQTAAAVVTRINTAAGVTIASQSSGTVTVKGLVKGTKGKLVLANLTAGALAALNLTAGTTAGTGNVQNLQLVTAAELAALVNAAAGLAAVNAKATVLTDGLLAFYDSTAGAGTISIAAGDMATKLLVSAVATTIKAGEHAGGFIRAGTRVRTAGGLEWVTLETTQIAAGTNAAPNIGPHRLKVRPAYDDGTAAGAAGAAVTVLVDQPTFATFAITNPSALTAALTESQLDAQYLKAIDKTMDATAAAGAARDINYQYCARRSLPIDTYGADKAEEASNTGFAGRKWFRGGALGITKAQAKADRALIQSDRVWYTWPGWQVVIPEILRRGAAGGVGFSDDGIVTVRATGPLAKISALLPPEENPGQQTDLITTFFAVEKLPFVLTPNDYADLKASGICAPRVDGTAGSIYQSGVTTDLTPARATQQRRKMADFVQDSLARLSVKHSKKTATEGRQDAVIGEADSFLSGLLSEEDSERQRIASYSIDLSPNTADTEALGIFTYVAKVRTIHSMDAIEIRTEIGPGVVTVTEV